jgi:hypothetical protein
MTCSSSYTRLDAERPATMAQNTHDFPAGSFPMEISSRISVARAGPGGAGVSCGRTRSRSRRPIAITSDEFITRARADGGPDWVSSHDLPNYG